MITTNADRRARAVTSATLVGSRGQLYELTILPSGNLEIWAPEGDDVIVLPAGAKNMVNIRLER